MGDPDPANRFLVAADARMVATDVRRASGGARALLCVRRITYNRRSQRVT